MHPNSPEKVVMWSAVKGNDATKNHSDKIPSKPDYKTTEINRKDWKMWRTDPQNF